MRPVFLLGLGAAWQGGDGVPAFYIYGPSWEEVSPAGGGPHGP